MSKKIKKRWIKSPRFFNSLYYLYKLIIYNLKTFCVLLKIFILPFIWKIYFLIENLFFVIISE